MEQGFRKPLEQCSYNFNGNKRQSEYQKLNLLPRQNRELKPFGLDNT